MGWIDPQERMILQQHECARSGVREEGLEYGIRLDTSACRSNRGASQMVRVMDVKGLTLYVTTLSPPDLRHIVKAEEHRMLE